MKILYIYDGDWPKAAVRVRKETAALAASGYQVVLLSRNESREPRAQSESWMTIRRLPFIPGRLTNRLFNFPFFFNPVWIGAILSAVRKEDPDGIIIADLPLAPSAVFVGRLFGLPVLYDMAEVYPEFLRGLAEFKDRTWADRLIRNPGPAEVLDKLVLRRVAHTFVVSEESKARAVSIGVPSDRVTVVGNTPEDLDVLSSPAPVPEILREHRHRQIVLFVGILISDRGLVQTVRAMETVRDSHPEALLVIVGDGLERPAIEEEVVALGLRDSVLLAGWRQPSELPGFYQAARVGLLPFLDGGQIRLTLANKLFDYLGAGLPVVASDVPPMRRILGEASVGFLVDPGKPEAIAAGINKMLSGSDEDWEKMASAGMDLVKVRYNWTRDSERFVAAVDRVLGRPGPSANHQA